MRFQPQTPSVRVTNIPALLDHIVCTLPPKDLFQCLLTSPAFFHAAAKTLYRCVSVDDRLMPGVLLGLPKATCRCGAGNHENDDCTHSPSVFSKHLLVRYIRQTIVVRSHDTCICPSLLYHIALPRLERIYLVDSRDGLAMYDMALEEMCSKPYCPFLKNACSKATQLVLTECHNASFAEATPASILPNLHNLIWVMGCHDFMILGENIGAHAVKVGTTKEVDMLCWWDLLDNMARSVMLEGSLASVSTSLMEAWKSHTDLAFGPFNGAELAVRIMTSLGRYTSVDKIRLYDFEAFAQVQLGAVNPLVVPDIKDSAVAAFYKGRGWKLHREALVKEPLTADEVYAELGDDEYPPADPIAEGLSVTFLTNKDFFRRYDDIPPEVIEVPEEYQLWNRNVVSPLPSLVSLRQRCAELLDLPEWQLWPFTAGQLRYMVSNFRKEFGVGLAGA
ncbi:hypothetical protein L198_02650 [Cryptococcus wingfieldii CBS 7118]|uniref:F-box domain-containing protein n=1 Tax=Cryptococcus wingfieldii CBS 7118 TaxID=1295528 RepID=A0A1E3JM40_9TREE|nr:hypothetical protein L198_02650 [Cryptococcus wingfieldii CBS 7118]ODO01920.1 hypothetical protein L198_02650 [Cryptococcus wingfieldii CBS 7118]